jgi:shikimate kinase
MGTGKSTAGRLVAERLGWRFVDSDAQIVVREGVSIAMLFAERGEPEFRRIEREVVRALVSEHEVVVATGGGALINDDTRAFALAHALVICLSASPEVLEARLAGDEARPLLKGDWRGLLEQRQAVYAVFPHQIDTTNKTPGEVAEEVLALWQHAST